MVWWIVFELLDKERRMLDRNDFRRRKYKITPQTHVSHARKISMLKLYFTEIDVKEINKWKVEKL
jgi:hypothetical protein